MLHIFALYVCAMRFANSKYGRAHLCGLREEVIELLEDRNSEELWDVLHTILRLTGSTWLGFMAYPTARKMALRYAEYGDIRSKRRLSGVVEAK